MTDIHKLTGAFATDALDDLERSRFERHLASCEDCRAEVVELREAAARLAETTVTTPPASLRDSVLAGISQVRPLPPLTPETTSGEPSHSSGTAPRRLRRWVPLLVAAALVLVAGVALSAWQPWATEETTTSATERVLAAPDAEKVFVDLGEAGRATVVRSRSEDRAVIVTQDMAPAPRGSVYELWLQSPEEEMLPAGLMPDAPDTTMLLEGSAAQATAVGITVEPEGGSPEPTTDPIALFPFDEAS